MAPSGGGGGDG
jgi:hypothetical protein